LIVLLCTSTREFLNVLSYSSLYKLSDHEVVPILTSGTWFICVPLLEAYIMKYFLLNKYKRSLRNTILHFSQCWIKEKQKKRGHNNAFLILIVNKHFNFKVNYLRLLLFLITTIFHVIHIDYSWTKYIQKSIYNTE
jgi:hypothetical protein